MWVKVMVKEPVVGMWRATRDWVSSCSVKRSSEERPGSVLAPTMRTPWGMGWVEAGVHLAGDGDEVQGLCGEDGGEGEGDAGEEAGEGHGVQGKWKSAGVSGGGVGSGSAR